MIDPITALTAISSAVALVKKVAKTVDDVSSLGPVLGKYFQAKEQAIEVVKKAKAGDFKGSALAAHDARRQREAKRKRAAEIEEIVTISAAIVITLALFFFILWLVLPKVR